MVSLSNHSAEPPWRTRRCHPWQSHAEGRGLAESFENLIRTSGSQKPAWKAGGDVGPAGESREGGALFGGGLGESPISHPPRFPPGKHAGLRRWGGAHSRAPLRIREPELEGIPGPPCLALLVRWKPGRVLASPNAWYKSCVMAIPLAPASTKPESTEGHRWTG